MAKLIPVSKVTHTPKFLLQSGNQAEGFHKKRALFFYTKDKFEDANFEKVRHYMYTKSTVEKDKSHQITTTKCNEYRLESPAFFFDRMGHARR
jgi:hypothetical protein